MESAERYCLSIAGLDPSGGAGLLADIKTMEQFGIHGLGVCSAITFQNEKKISGIEWLSLKNIIEQLNSLFEIYSPKVAKIGIIENAEVLKEIVNFLFTKNKNIRIIWDPVLRSSSNFEFHSSPGNWTSVLENIFLITPNINEVKALTGIDDEEKAALFLAKQCNVLLKGGHSESESSNDLLFIYDKIISIPGERFSKEKHGTGCVLSSAVASNLVLGKTLEESCRAGKDYVSQYLLSSSGLLGHHYLINHKEHELGI